MFKVWLYTREFAIAKDRNWSIERKNLKPTLIWATVFQAGYHSRWHNRTRPTIPNGRSVVQVKCQEACRCISWPLWKPCALAKKCFKMFQGQQTQQKFHEISINFPALGGFRRRLVSLCVGQKHKICSGLDSCIRMVRLSEIISGHLPSRNPQL